MKKILLLTSILALMLSSCSNDDNPVAQTPTDSGSLVKTITNPDGTFETFNYNGNKLVSIISSDNIEDVFYTYTGDNITNITVKNELGIIISKTDFFYNANNKVASNSGFENFFGTQQYFRNVFAYNNDGTVKETDYSGNATVQNTYEGYNLFHLDSNKNVIKIDVHDSNNVLTSIESGTVDNKPCPNKNILGITQILRDSYDNIFGMYNNYISSSIIFITGSNTIDTANYTYTYNSNNYPISILENGTGEVTTYTYY